MAMNNQWPPCDPNTFRHQIQIKALTTTQDDSGQPMIPDDGGWNLVRATSASIEALTDKEVFSAGQTTSQGVYKITCRWTPVQIVPGMQIIFANQVYQIQAVDNVLQRNEYLKLTCLALNSGG